MWYLLNYIPPRGKSRAMLPGIIDAFNRSHAPSQGTDNRGLPPAGLELFAPTFVSLADSSEGNVSRRVRPLLYHYIFLRGPENLVKLLCTTNQGFSFVLDRNSRRRVTLSDDTIDRFRIIARFYSGQLPCYPLEDISLEEGDKVQIVTGACAGLTGTYMSRKGGKSGNILVAVDTTMAAIVYDIPADYVRVLEFARDSRRVYDQLDAFVARIRPYLVNPGQAESVSPLPVRGGDGAAVSQLPLLAASTVFTRRLSDTRLPNPKLDAKRQILLYAAYSILGDAPAALQALKRYRALSHHITNEKTRSLCSSILTTFPQSTETAN